ncbi:MAG TPA: hypothetical protein VJX10_08865 [Pseudonocardiaceae bacterium]|nr:hypothetical protein [Pseudonocardiaceae bacterium]
MPPAQRPYHSARRLVGAIERLRAEAASRPTAPLLELVAAAGGMEPRNPAVLGLAEALVALPTRLAADVADLDSDQVAYARPGLRSLTETLTVANLQTPWADLSARIGDNEMSALAICSLVLDAHAAERQLDTTTLARIADDCRNLLAEIRLADNLPADVLEYVESALVALMRAIDEYWLKGAGLVAQAVDTAVGRAVREHHFDTDDKNSKPVLKRLGIILARVALVIALANDLHSLPNTVHDVVHGIVDVTHEITEPPGSGPDVAGGR